MCTPFLRQIHQESIWRILLLLDRYIKIVSGPWLHETDTLKESLDCTLCLKLTSFREYLVCTSSIRQIACIKKASCVCLLVGWLLHVSVWRSQGQICLDVLPHIEVEVAGQTRLSHSVTICSHRANHSQHWPCKVREATRVPVFKVTGMTRPKKSPK